MRLIDEDALEERVCGELDKIISTAYFSLQKDAARIRQGIVLAIESEPAVDAEPVVRCRDCRYWDKTKQPTYGNQFCFSTMMFTAENHYCGRGAKMNLEG